MDKVIVASLVAAVGIAASAIAADAPSVEWGKKLFGSTDLGTNGKSCATCHPNGQGVEETVDIPAEKRPVIVNTCIKKALKGEELEPASPEMRSIILYMESLATPPAK